MVRRTIFHMLVIKKADIKENQIPFMSASLRLSAYVYNQIITQKLIRRKPLYYIYQFHR